MSQQKKIAATKRFHCSSVFYCFAFFRNRKKRPPAKKRLKWTKLFLSIQMQLNGSWKFSLVWWNKIELECVVSTIKLKKGFMKRFTRNTFILMKTQFLGTKNTWNCWKQAHSSNNKNFISLLGEIKKFFNSSEESELKLWEEAKNRTFNSLSVWNEIKLKYFKRLAIKKI